VRLKARFSTLRRKSESSLSVAKGRSAPGWVGSRKMRGGLLHPPLGASNRARRRLELV
jgi:hypothetical protein